MDISEVIRAFESAADAYRKTTDFNPYSTIEDRFTAAGEFRRWIEYFKSVGPTADAIFEAELYSDEPHRSAAAARLWIECGDVRSLTRLSQDAVAFRGRIRWPDLKRLWTIVPPPREALDEFRATGADELAPLMHALLLQPTAEAQRLFADLVNGSDYGLLTQALASVARWNMPSPLREVMQSYIVDAAILADWDGLDVRVEAAFYLGLQGDQAGIDYLRYAAYSPERRVAVRACHALAQLALPDAVEPTMELLRCDDGDVVRWALNIAADLGLPLFVPALCDIAQNKLTSPVYDSETPLYDEAIRALRDIVGGPLLTLDEDNAEPESGGFYGEGEFSEAFRSQAIALAQSAITTMNPVLRYSRGDLLTLGHLASDLLNRHSGPFLRAAHNLRAMCGEDYGLDVEDDLIANFPAIVAWMRRVQDNDLLSPSGWAFAGKPLPTPIFRFQ